MHRRYSHDRTSNRTKLEDRRKHLRNFSTSAEAALWILLKGKQLDGKKFRREHSIGSYILDFYCPSEMLAVELDGDPHFTEEGIAYDKIRTEYINGLGIRIVRFENVKVFEQPEVVLEKIRSCFA